MTVINTNVKSLVAQDSLSKTNRTLSTAMERLSTGKRINRAADDAAGLAIATRMDSQVRGLTQAIRNANDGISIVQTTEGAMEEVTSMLQRMRELAVQSVNDSNNANDRTAMNAEVEQLKKEIDRIASTTQFNNMNLLDGTFKGKVLQIGDKANQTMKLDVDSVKTIDLGKGGKDSGANTLISARLDFETAGATNDDIKDGQIKINEVALKAFTAGTDDIEDIILDINGKNLGVKASGFNTVVADTVGTGVTAAGDLTIKVKALGAATETTYAISASNSMAELVDNINKEAGGAVQASLSSDGKLVLANETGATIKIADSGTVKQSGFTAAAEKAYQGFLKLESTDGNPIRITKGDLSNTTLETRDVLTKIGFHESVRNNTTDGYTVRGGALTAAGAAAAWQDGDLKLNGVNIYSAEVATTSLQGKIDAINAFSAQTGVKASMYAEKSYITNGKVIAVTDAVVVNGIESAALTAATPNALVDAINSLKDKTNVTARLEGTNIVVTGRDSNQVTLGMVVAATHLTTASTGTVFTAAAATTPDAISAGIQLDSLDNSPISIQLSDAADSNANLAGASRKASFGLLEQNVGAADFDTNASTVNPFGSQAIARISVATTDGATKALGVIDNAITQISDARSNLGAVQNRLEKTVNNLTNIVTNTTQSRSRIQDADYGVETTNLAKAQIISQAATAMLAQANQSSQSVLSLLK